MIRSKGGAPPSAPPATAPRRSPTLIELSPARPAPVDPATVTLVRPAMVVPKLALTAPTCPPIGLAYLAGSLRAAGHEVTVIDAVGLAPDRYEERSGGHALTHGLTPNEIVDLVPADTEVIGVSCMFSHEWPANREVIVALRRRFPAALLIVGGEHPTALAERVLEDCPAVDLIVRGEAEATIVSVVDHRHDAIARSTLPGVVARTDAASSSAAAAAPVSRIAGIDDIAPPAWDLLPIRTYLDRGLGFGVHRGRSMPLLATRGCPYQCTFCSSPSMWTTRWSARSPHAVVAEIEGYLDQYDIDNVDFYDLTAIVKKSWIVEFCRLVIDRDLRFTWQLPSGTRSEAIDAEVVSLLYRAGCRNMSYAPESGSPELLARIKKKVDLDRMKVSMRAAVDAGINCKANIMVGLPGETHADARRTLRFCVDVALLGLHDLSITLFSPYPGTELFDELRANGRIAELDDDYFASLAAYSDLTTAQSWSDHLSDRAANRYRMLGMSLFYGVSFLRRPWRLVPLVRNVFVRDTQDSRLEMTLRQLIEHRARTRHRRGAPVDAGHVPQPPVVARRNG